jgi:hypothetical protein
MKTILLVVPIMVTTVTGSLVAQEEKRVPKDSARVSIPGCTKGYIFTAGRRRVDEPGTVDVPQGTHFRMNGPKKVIADIKAHEGSMIMLTGVVKKGQYLPDGVNVGGGVRVSPGTGPTAGSLSPTPGGSQSFIDVEAFRLIEGSCSSR